MNADLTSFWNSLGIDRSVESSRYMSDGRDAGSLEEIFTASEIAALSVGGSLGPDVALGCFDRWHVYDGHGVMVFDIRDDAAGYTFHDPIA